MDNDLKLKIGDASLNSSRVSSIHLHANTPGKDMNVTNLSHIYGLPIRSCICNALLSRQNL